MSQIITVSRPAPGIGVISINRPEKRNALNESAWDALARGFSELTDDREVRVIVLTGVPGAFCAGDDIGAFAEASKDPVTRERYWNTITRCYAALSDASVPVIAAIDGPCVGGGMTLALRADFRLVGPRALFSVPPAKLGLVYPADSTARLAALVGAQAARYMIYTAASLDAAEAVATGLAWADTAEDPLAEALSLAAKIADKAPLTVTAARTVLNRLATQLPEGLADEIAALTRKAEDSDDYVEGVSAFKAKRAPVFTGR
ncbi:enoyl-CoA hydratase/isomerase family protein [Salipiger sp. HF18]|uniref:enoyl-CoA hydratase/isomerase family protein n=1 Tax=Salipiger sp. HF18 TaxID=2721557 RepID=UPI00142D29ED|nr:enoyl-CoA hydratase-related protein [Salipiger sp. HF18]NIY96158.1 enoyl-CoA hydratase/isomerase family protein [Salipiger sp. HF18]